VDVEKIANKWIGDSEKNTKKIFDEYYEFSNQCELTPILFFNEDSIFSKRVEVGHSSDRTHNSMQNILLEELEKFDGILFATTNLLDNIDDAFDRRFLFKIEFKKPSNDIRKKIWHSKLNFLDKKQLCILAAYDMTGAQIELVARKYMLRKILYNMTFNIDDLINYIDKEIGYKNSDICDFDHIEGSKIKTDERAMTLPELVKTYKYLVDIGGIGFSGRLPYLLFSNRPLLLIDRDYVQYFYNDLEPYVHYVPVKQDLSDFIEKVRWMRNNEDKCKEIALNAQNFAIENFTYEKILEKVKEVYKNFPI
jgi:glycosyltransferase involved in cell wall biosynthesis